MPMLALSAAALFTLCTGSPRTDCVIDGDTFWLGRKKVRIADINAPETLSAMCPEERRMGEASKRRLLTLLNAGAFTLEPEPRERDRYGRLLRVVKRDGRSLGLQLVAEGLAERWQGRRSDWCATLGGTVPSR